MLVTAVLAKHDHNGKKKQKRWRCVAVNTSEKKK